MKASHKTPAPRKGPGKGKNTDKGGAPVPQSKIMKAHRSTQEVLAEVTAQPHYNQGLRYGTPNLRYAVGDAPTPEASASQAKVVMELSRRSDDNLSGYIGNHITLITGDARFSAPQPLPADLLAALTAFQNAQAVQIEALAVAKAATTAKDMLRKTLEDLMTSRGAYVQTTSAGNASMIEDVGLGVKAPPSPVGPLMPPGNLRTDLNGTAGVMKLRWEGVAGARGYIVQCSEDVQPRAWSQIKNTSKTSLLLESLEVGTTYVFRIASQGGSTGQSPWSAEVKRGAA